jgi:hypothetical protein
MGNVFEKAIEIAIERQAWEERVNPKKESFVLRGFTSQEMAQSQKMIASFQKAIHEAAKEGQFKTASEVEEALEPLKGTAGKAALGKMAEMCVPVEPSTMAIAKALAPGRVGSIERIRSGSFGVGERPEETAKREAQAQGNTRQQRAVEPQRSATKEEVAARAKAQGEAFDALLAAGGEALRMAKPGTVSAIEKKGSLARLPATRMVEGEREERAPTPEPLPRGQISLFDDAQLPIPEGVQPKRKKSAPKGGR